MSIVSPYWGIGHNNCPVDDVTLYRAVKPEELADIQTTGQLINRGSAEGKYFSATSEGAASYARQAYYGFGDPPYTLVRTQIPAGSLTLETRAVVDRGVQTVVLPNEILPGLVPEILPWMPIPVP